MVKSIAFYVSDHGFGHATRTIAVVRAVIKANPKVKISIITSRNAKFMREALSLENVIVREKINDFGLITANNLSINPKKTRFAFEKWVAVWEKWLATEQNVFDKRIDLIISDIAPQPFILAEKIGLPSIAISNFTWLDQYAQMFESELFQQLAEAYSSASSALVLPFSMEMAGIKSDRKKDIPLVYREPTRDLKKIQSQYPTLKGKKLIFIRAEGGSLDYSLSIARWKEPGETCFVTGSRTIEGGKKQILNIPKEEIEHQDFVIASQLVVSKPGYSILSEAVAGRAPMILIKVEGFPEAEIMGGKAEALGIGQFLSKEEVVSGKWLEKKEALRGQQEAFNHLSSRFLGNGSMVAAEHILEYLTR
ncbi:MAG: glycosyltransferase family protein [Candidatus Hodarchaeota archaeon]